MLFTPRQLELIPTRKRFSYGLMFTVLAVFPISHAASEDLLTLPASHSEYASKSTLLDITEIGDRIVVVGERGHILSSDNLGESWRQGDVPVSVTLTAVEFASQKAGWAIGHDGVILATRDGGETWVKQLDGGDVNHALLDQVKQLYRQKTIQIEETFSKDLLESLEIELEDLEFFISDAEMASEEGATRPFLDIWVKDESFAIVVGAFGMAFETRDGGITWHPILDRIANPEGLHFYAIEQVGSSLYLAGEYGIFYRSDDEGINWNQITSPYDGSLFGIAGSQDGKVLLTFGLRGNAFFSEDRGQSWDGIVTDTKTAISDALVTPDGDIYLLANDGNLIIKKDSQNSLNQVHIGIPGAVAMILKTNKLVFATIFGAHEMVIQ